MSGEVVRSRSREAHENRTVEPGEFRLNKLADSIFKPEILQEFERLFARSSLDVSDYLDSLESEFRYGADPTSLSPEAREDLEVSMATLREHYQTQSRPLLTEHLAPMLEENLDYFRRLTVSGPVAEDGRAHALTQRQQTAFSEFGVLPPLSFSGVSRESLDRVEGVLDGMLSSDGSALEKMDRRLNSNYAYLFSKEILDLAMSDDIVAKVESLLGDNITFVGSSGPLYKTPGSGTKQQTQWHSADARGFGGGTESNLDLVTVWVALSDSKLDNGCMKIMPKSFPLNIAKERLIPHELFRDQINYPGQNVEALLRNLMALDYQIDLPTVEKLISRRLGFHDTNKLFYVDNSSGFKKYSPFQSSVDQTMCLGLEALVDLTRVRPIPMLAEKGQFYMFTSQNNHASYPNDSDRWRKAIAFRFVRTGRATQSTAIDSEFYLGEYLKVFPKCADQLQTLGKQPSDFRTAVPRLLVKGEIPAGQEQFYIDRHVLRESLEHNTFLA